MTRIWVRLALALLALAASSSAVSAQPAALPRPTGDSTIRGRVIAADTRFPVRDAFVGVIPAGPSGPVMLPRDTPPAGAVPVDPDGRFEITGVAAGRLRLLATPADVEVVLSRRLFTVRGRALSRSGAATDAAIIMFSENPSLWHERATTTRLIETRADGTFRLDGVRPGRYFIVAVPREGASLSGSTAPFFALLAKRAVALSVEGAAPQPIELTVQPIR